MGQFAGAAVYDRRGFTLVAAEEHPLVVARSQTAVIDRRYSLWPICVRKMQHSVSFDAVRYEKLARFYRAQDFPAESEWCERQVARAAGSGTLALAGLVQLNLR